MKAGPLRMGILKWGVLITYKYARITEQGMVANKWADTVRNRVALFLHTYLGFELITCNYDMEGKKKWLVVSL